MLSKKQIQDRDIRLAKVATSLSRRPMTAQEVAVDERIVPATAYAWIKILLRRRMIRLSGKVRGSSGSWANVYGAVVKKVRT